MDICHTTAMRASSQGARVISAARQEHGRGDKQRQRKELRRIATEPGNVRHTMKGVKVNTTAAIAEGVRP